MKYDACAFACAHGCAYPRHHNNFVSLSCSRLSLSDSCPRLESTKDESAHAFLVKRADSTLTAKQIKLFFFAPFSPYPTRTVACLFLVFSPLASALQYPPLEGPLSSLPTREPGPDQRNCDAHPSPCDIHFLYFTFQF